MRDGETIKRKKALRSSSFAFRRGVTSTRHFQMHFFDALSPDWLSKTHLLLPHQSNLLFAHKAPLIDLNESFILFLIKIQLISLCIK